MPDRLSVSDIANIIGVDEKVVHRTLARGDEELVPYLYREPIIRSQADEMLDAEPDTGEDQVEEPLSAVMLSVDGLPILLTKLAFNIPTSDLIENLACQVLHLTVLQEDNAALEREMHALERENKELQESEKKARTEVELLQTKVSALTDCQSRGWLRNLFGRQDSD